MKVLKIFTILFVLNAFHLCGQTFSGEVIDLETSEVLPFSTVSLFKQDTLVYGAIADASGQFEFKDLVDGKYRLESSYLGYALFVDHINVTSDAVENIKLMLVKEPSMLSQIVLVGYDPNRNKNGCTLWSRVRADVVDTILNKRRFRTFGLNHNFKTSSLYPNPTIHFFNVNNDLEYDRIEVYSSAQKSVFSDDLIAGTRINTSSWFPGLYMVLLFKENKLVKTEKLVVCQP